MQLEVTKSKISGKIEVPGSKSHTIRAVAIAAMAEGTSTIKAPLISEDTLSCLTTASALGAWIKRGDDTVWRISGTGKNILQPANTLNLGNSGTSLRIFSGMAALGSFKISFDGDDSLRTRLMGPLLEAYEKLGAKTESTNGKCPLSIHGPINGGEIEIEGKTSQFLTALLLACPLCEKDSVIKVKNLHERPYIELTLEYLKMQDIIFEVNKDFNIFKIKGGQEYKPFSPKIPADFSTATFPLVAAAVTGGEAEILNLDFKDKQGDKQVFEHMKQMGVKIETKDGITKVKGPKKLKAIDIDLNSTPDALPALTVAAACAEGTSYFRNVAQARIKETDRIACMAAELAKLGITVEEFSDGIAVTGGKMKGARVESYKDHRIAMSLAIAGMAAEGRTLIDNAEAAAVTYPDFVEDFMAIGANFKQF